MSSLRKKRILIVEDYSSIRVTMSRLLVSAGYEVSTAEHGFSALLQLKRGVPDLILSDLNMPQMSGFEFLSVVRRRFPEVLVVAMSGAYGAGEAVPGGVIADAFYAKGQNNPEALLALIADLLQTSASQVLAHTRESAPVWIPRNGKDSHGIPYIVLTCTECLRSFPLNVPGEVTSSVVTTPCIFCLSEVRYIIDFSLSVASPKKQVANVPSCTERQVEDRK
jgi:CheY-like chemotaxis protein